MLLTLIRYARLGGMVLHLLLGVAIVLCLYPWSSEQRQEKLARWWSACIFRWCRMQLHIRGEIPKGPRLFVMNHISWLDIYALNALKPSHFVAKSEIRGWPLVGLLADRAGTLFIERGRRHAVHAVIHQLALRMKAGHTAAVFPEGTTTRGRDLLPFHANLMQAAIEAGVPVTPVAIRYTHHGVRTEIPAYVDGMSLAASMGQVLATPGMSAELTLLPELHPQDFATRHALAKAAQDAIGQQLSTGANTALGTFHQGK